MMGPYVGIYRRKPSLNLQQTLISQLGVRFSLRVSKSKDPNSRPFQERLSHWSTKIWSLKGDVVSYDRFRYFSKYTAA